jgi:hypothetical protein
MKRVDDAYVTDAYHSLSIEGYRVSRKLIERVRSNTWNPETNEQDRGQRDASHGRARVLAGLSGRSKEPGEDSERRKSRSGRR